MQTSAATSSLIFVSQVEATKRKLIFGTQISRRGFSAGQAASGPRGSIIWAFDCVAGSRRGQEFRGFQMKMFELEDVVSFVARER